MDSATVTIHVPENKPYFNTPSEACPGEMIPCAIYGNNNLENLVNWDFGDGYITTTTFTEHAYTDTGSFTIIMTVNNPSCGIIIDSNQIVISSSIIPTVHIHPENEDSIICPGENFPYFYDEYLPIVWDFGNGLTSTDPYPVFLFQNEGLYPVSISVTNECGNSNTLDKYIVVTDTAVPIATIYVDPTNACPNQPINFYGGSGFNNTFLWDLGDGTVDSSMDITHHYNDTGSYEVRLTVTNVCGNSDTSIMQVSIHDSLTPSGWLYMDNNEGCPGSEIIFIGTSGFAEYDWSFGDGSTSQDRITTHSFSDTGMYSIELIITNECGNSASYFDTVYIHNSYYSTANFILPQTTYCSGDQLHLSAINDGQISSYLWLMGDGTSLNSNNIQHTYLDTGSYTISLIATNDCGNSDTLSRTIIINNSASPVVSFETNTGNTICPNTTVQFANQSSDTTNCIWSFGNGDSSNNPNPVYSFTEPGNYLITLTVQNGCGNTAISTLPITISTSLMLSAPSVSCQTFNDSILVTWTAVNGAVGYEISWDGGLSWTFVPHPLNQFTLSGTQNETYAFIIRAIGDSYCYYGEVSDSTVCTILNGINPIQKNILSIWHPNPVHQSGSIHYTNSRPTTDCKEPLLVKIYDSNNRLLENLLFKDGNIAKINTDNYLAGIYLLHTTKCDESNWQKIIITK